jgi:lipopolysaccharide export system protein LptA
VKIYIPILLALLVLSAAFAESEPIELLHAATMQKVSKDISELENEFEGSYLMFDKDVHIKQGAVHLYADRIYQFTDIDLLRLFGNVRIFDDSVRVEFEQGEYNTKSKDLKVNSAFTIQYDGREFSALSMTGNFDRDVYLAKGKIEIKDSISYAYADSLRFDRENERAWLYGEALMSDTVNNITMRGEELEYRLDTDEFFGHKNASVYETNKDGKKRFEVFAGKMKGDMKHGWLIASKSVYVVQDSSSAWCDSLFYNDSLQTVEFHGNAHLQYQELDMFGPEMYLDFYQDHLGMLTAPRDPQVSLREEGFIGEKRTIWEEKISTVHAKELYLDFNEKDQPDWMDMVGMVTSDYHVFKDSVYKGLNHMRSDTLHIVFEEGDVADLFAIFEVEGRFDPDTSYKEMDTSVFYYGNEAHYSLKKDNMYIYPSAKMNYGNIKLQADTMKIDWKTNILYAMPGKSGELPEFIQNNDAPVYGRLFEYNLDTQRGRITRGKTSIKEGYYQGATVLKTEEEPLYVKNGVFSTCELEHPHFCIEAQQMKVIPGDRVFAQDLVLKVMDIPLLYIPSLFVSIEEGNRRSGWIIPGFVNYTSRGWGWGLEGSGYYWAPNDYYDARILLDFYDGLGVKAELRQRYALEHYISGGSVTLKYWNNFLATTPKQGYEISVNHPQRIGQKSSLTINGKYTNDASRYSEELDIDEQLEQQMISNANFKTSLGPFSMSVSASHTQDLLTGNSTSYLPQFSISKSQASIIQRKSKTSPEKWYHKFKYDISSSLTNRFTHTWNTTDSLFNDQERNKMVTKAGVQYSDKFFGFLSIRPYANYYEDWTMKYYVPEMQNDSAMVDTNGNIVLNEVNGFKRRGRYDLGTSASTTLYGVFNVNLGPLKAIRHTLGMSLNYVFRPDQSYNPDYVFRGIGTDSSKVVYDYFSGTLLGSTPSSESQTFNMSFRHSFDAKTVNRDGKEEKTTFLSLSHSYNFLADSLNSSTISASSSIRDLPGGMDLKMSATFDPYAYRINEDGSSITRINQLALPRMTSFRIGTDIVIKPKTRAKRVVMEEIIDTTKVRVSEEIAKPVKGSDSGFSKWSITSGISYDLKASNPLDIQNSLLITTTMKANLSPKWSGSYKINFDVLEQKITDQSISLKRDMHCWTLSLDWRPGYSVFVRLNAKSTLLKDFKLLQKKSYY